MPVRYTFVFACLLVLTLYHSDKYRGSAPRSTSSQHVPGGNDRRDYVPRQQSDRQEAYPNSQGPSALRNDPYPAAQLAQIVEVPDRSQSAPPPVQNTSRRTSRYTRIGATAPLSYNPGEDLPEFAPPPSPPAQYYTGQSSKQPSSSPNAPAYQDIQNGAPAAPQWIKPESNAALSSQQVTPPSTGWQPTQSGASGWRPPFLGQAISSPALMGGQLLSPGQTLASSASIGGQPPSIGQAPSIGQTLPSYKSSGTGVGSPELTLMEIEKYLRNKHQTPQNDPATYLRAEEEYVKHILTKMSTPIGNSFADCQRSYASEVSKSMPKICSVSISVMLVENRSDIGELSVCLYIS